MDSIEIIEMTVNGHTGYAKVQWMLETEYNMPHYAAFICVPFQRSRWVPLFISKKEECDLAVQEAKAYLEMALNRCTLC